MKEQKQLKRLVNAMGGIERREVNEKANFLVTTNLKSTKYNNATGVYDIPVLKRQSLIDAWERRNDPNFRFDSKQFYEQYIYKVRKSFKAMFNYVLVLLHEQNSLSRVRYRRR